MFKIQLFLSLFFLDSALAARIQILHTNDLHASLQTAGAPPQGDIELGGWAQVKTILDQLTQEAAKSGIESIRLDGGDFSEGTLHYFADSGKNSIRAFQAMNFDVAVFGNHDWKMGARSLNRVFAENPFPFPVLGANLSISHRLSALKKQITPSTQLIRGGIKIGILGITTDEIVYKWMTRIGSKRRDLRVLNWRDDPSNDGVYGNPVGIANREAEKLAKSNDLVIALTHIGLDQDKFLAKNSKHVDLIVGGHSHTALSEITSIKNNSQRDVPIVQAGSNGKYVGKIIIDVEPGSRPKLVSYELIPVPHDTPKDPVVLGFVEKSEQRLVELYGKEKLDEVLGYSEVRLSSGASSDSNYSKLAVDAMRISAKTDLAIDVGLFHGITPQPAGSVTRRHLMEMYPRKFEVGQNEGLYIYRARIPGWVIKLAIRYAVKFGYSLAYSGLHIDTEDQFDPSSSKSTQHLMAKKRLKDIRVRGNKIKPFKQYSVAMSETLIRGAWGVSPLTRLIIRWGRPTRHTIWDATANHLKHIKVVPPGNPNKVLAESTPLNEIPDSIVSEFMSEIKKGPSLSDFE